MGVQGLTDPVGQSSSKVLTPPPLNVFRLRAGLRDRGGPAGPAPCMALHGVPTAARRSLLWWHPGGPKLCHVGCALCEWHVSYSQAHLPSSGPLFPHLSKRGRGREGGPGLLQGTPINAPSLLGPREGMQPKGPRICPGWQGTPWVWGWARLSPGVSLPTQTPALPRITSCTHFAAETSGECRWCWGHTT